MNIVLERLNHKGCWTRQIKAFMHFSKTPKTQLYNIGVIIRKTTEKNTASTILLSPFVPSGRSSVPPAMRWLTRIIATNFRQRDPDGRTWLFKTHLLFMWSSDISLTLLDFIPGVKYFIIHHTDDKIIIGQLGNSLRKENSLFLKKTLYNRHTLHVHLILHANYSAIDPWLVNASNIW